MELQYDYLDSIELPFAHLMRKNQTTRLICKHSMISDDGYLSLNARCSVKQKIQVFKYGNDMYTLCLATDDGNYFVGPVVLIYGPYFESRGFKDVYHFANIHRIERERLIKQMNILARLLQCHVTTQMIGLALDNPVILQLPVSDSFGISTDNEQAHTHYYYEEALSDAIETGNDTVIHETLMKLIDSGQTGHLSDEGKLRNVKNFGIILVSVLIRTAIRSGVDYEHAFDLNDRYVRELERLKTPDEIVKVIEIELKDLTQRVSRMNLTAISVPVRQAIKLILKAPNNNISVRTIGEQLNLNCKYLSNRFKAEMVLSISSYKLLIKINKALPLVMTTDVPLLEIANLLGFTDQAHFTRVFSRFVGMSPSKVRKNPQLAKDCQLRKFIKQKS